MARFAMLVLCVLLAAAAAGRYKAEVSVRKAREELKSLESAKAKEETEIQLLRAEIAWLESPERLAKIASQYTDLKPLAGAQLLTADEFLASLGAAPARAAPERPDGDIILHALAMADFGGAP